MTGLPIERVGELAARDGLILHELRTRANTLEQGFLTLTEPQAGMPTGLRKFSGTKVVQRSSCPKLLVMNTALMSASMGKTFDELPGAPELWGRLVESAAGAHLLAGIHDVDAELFYWRDGRHEVDFVVRRGRQVLAIEVTGGRRKRSMEGMAAFVDRFGTHFEMQTLLIRGQGLDLADFLSRSVADLLG